MTNITLATREGDIFSQLVSPDFRGWKSIWPLLSHFVQAQPSRTKKKPTHKEKFFLV